MSETVDKLKSLPIDELFAEGEHYMKAEKYDEALRCFHICANKPIPQYTGKQVIETIVKAKRKEAQLLFYHFFDYGRACEALASAKQICTSHDLDKLMPSILADEAGFYLTYASQNRSNENFSIGEKTYQKAFILAAKQNDRNTMASAFSNIINRLYGEKRYKDLDKWLKLYRQHYKASTDTSENAIFADALLKGFSNAIDNKPELARIEFKKALTQNIKNPRHRFELNVAITRTFLSDGNLDSAIFYELEILKLSRISNLKDGKAVALSDLGKLYRAKGDSITAQTYEYLAMQEKDSLINIRRLDKVQSIKMLNDLYSLEKEVNESKAHNRRLITIIIIFFVGIAFTIVLAITFIRKHKTSVISLSKIDDDNNAEQKYQNSALSDTVKTILTRRIQSILMQPDQVVFTSHFSIDTLAKMCKTNTHYISQIINDIYGSNFSTLINTIRIEEACKRIDNPEKYGNVTLESIGLSVGYASRVSFTNAFKKVKGVTPSQYRANRAR